MSLIYACEIVFQDTVRELEGEISRLEREKANLNLELSSTKSELSEG